MQLLPYISEKNVEIWIYDGGTLEYKVVGLTASISIDGMTSECVDGLYYEVSPQEGTGELLGLTRGKRVYLKLKLAAGIRGATHATETELMDVFHGTGAWKNMVSRSFGVRSHKIVVLFKGLEFGFRNTKFTFDQVTCTHSFKAGTVSPLDIEGTVYGVALREMAATIKDPQ